MHTANMLVVAQEMTDVEEEHLHACVRACESLVQVVRVLKRVRSRFTTPKGPQCVLNVPTVRKRLQQKHYKLPWCAAAELVYDNSEAARRRRAALFAREKYVLFAKKMLQRKAVLKRC